MSDDHGDELRDRSDLVADGPQERSDVVADESLHRSDLVADELFYEEPSSDESFYDESYYDSELDESSDDVDDEDRPRRMSRARFGLVAAAVLVLAAVVGVGSGVLLSRRNDTKGSTPTPASTVRPSTATEPVPTTATVVPTAGNAATTTAVTPSTAATPSTATTPSSAPTASTVPAATAPISAATPTTAPSGPNVLGIENGTVADPLSARPEERFAAQMGRQTTEASPNTPASVYADWWVLFLVRTSDVVASPNGFSFTDASNQRVELSQMALGPDGKVSDLTECVSAGSSAPTCNVLSNAITLDPGATVVGQTPTVSFTRLGELRLLKRFVVHFFDHEATQPITGASSTIGDVRFNSKVLAFPVPVGTVPTTADVVLTYADGTSETVTITL